VLEHQALTLLAVVAVTVVGDAVAEEAEGLTALALQAAQVVAADLVI
jgi:hypothetical protein